MDIPPPRPKKKPLHPYPRKMVDSPITNQGNSAQSGWSPSLNASRQGKDTCSPESVLLPGDSDLSESPFAMRWSGHLAPASCTMDAHSGNVISTENDDECMTSNFTIEEEVPVTKVAADSCCPVTYSTTECDIISRDSSCSGEKPAVEAPLASASCLDMVFVPDAPSLDSQGPENYNSSPPGATQEKIKSSSDNLLHSFPSNQANAQFILAMVPGSMSAPACLLPQNMLNDNPKNEVSLPATMSWWSWDQDLTYRYISSGSQTATGSSAPCQGQNSEEPQREGSSSGSNIGSASEVDNVKRNCDVVESKCTSRSKKRDYRKGFVPYKRCLAERDGESSGVATEEREARRAQMSS